mgnify:FL=1
MNNLSGKDRVITYSMDLENEFLLETELSWKAQSQAVCTLEY